MKYSVVIGLMLSLLSATAETPQSVEIRFCPASAVRTYPLEGRRELQSLLLQNAAIINYGKAAFDVKEIELELLEAGQILDTKNWMPRPSSALLIAARNCRQRAFFNR
jgi:hypothetical protein